ncbi:MAG TPA: ATP-binding cassette domain-containing protein [Frankiaceae bacterium]|jgi:ABC-type branched-subunit amino acid transport system ATPase component|nr:ATP-binding cassette domain-containing protein [Frankiaceae bacterium]
MSGQTRLECVGVTVRFGGLVAVREVSLALPPASIVGLVGPNGAGKSTLFAVLSGLLRPTSGRVLLDGEDITDTRPQVRAAQGLARTFQHPELFVGMTIRDHLVIAHRAKHAKGRVLSDAFTMGSLRRPPKAETEAIDELIELLGLTGIANRSAVGLPLGVARLVELGRALAASPRVLLLDEPSSGLDSAETQRFEAVLRRVAQERDISVLLVEHDVELVMRLCSKVNVLDFGALLASGTPAEVRGNPAVRAAYLGQELAVEAKAADPAALEEQAVLARVEDVSAGPEAVPASVSKGPLLTVENLAVRYGDAVALNGVSFSLMEGRALAVLGANGAGKSSLARAISGLVPSAGGRIEFDGRAITKRSPHRIRRMGLVHLPEGRGVFRGLSVIDNLKMASATMEGRRARREAVDLALEIFPGLASRRGQTAGLLSGGEQQMLSLARALATNPKLIIADEMSLGLAPLVVDLVFDGLVRARSAGVTVIMIEQYVHRALGFADDCLVLQRGAIAWQGSAQDAHGEVVRHYLGDAMTATAAAS